MQAAQHHCEKAASDGRTRVQVTDPEFKQVTKEGDPEPDFDAAAVNQGLQPFRTALADLRV
jgi:hypothetical protein